MDRAALHRRCGAAERAWNRKKARALRGPGGAKGRGAALCSSIRRFGSNAPRKAMAALPCCEMAAGAPLSSWAAAPSHLAGSVSFMCSVKDLASFRPAQLNSAQCSPASCQFGPSEA